jgi:hypothetical protein
MRVQTTPGQCPLIVADPGDRTSPPRRRHNGQRSFPLRPPAGVVTETVAATGLQIPRRQPTQMPPDQNQHPLIGWREVFEPVTDRHTRRPRRHERCGNRTQHPPPPAQPRPPPAADTGPPCANSAHSWLGPQRPDRIAPEQLSTSDMVMILGSVYDTSARGEPVRRCRPVGSTSGAAGHLPTRSLGPHPVEPEPRVSQSSAATPTLGPGLRRRPSPCPPPPLQREQQLVLGDRRPAGQLTVAGGRGRRGGGARVRHAAVHVSQGRLSRSSWQAPHGGGVSRGARRSAAAS